MSKSTAKSEPAPVPVEEPEVNKSLLAQTLYPRDGLMPIAACCCSIVSCYCDGSFTCCYIEKAEQKEVRKGKRPKVELHCCECPTCCSCIPRSCPKCHCCKCSANNCFKIKCAQFFACCCLDFRCALPCVEEVPCMLSLLCLTCCFNGKKVCKCCASIGSLADATAAKEEGDEEEGQEMVTAADNTA